MSNELVSVDLRGTFRYWVRRLWIVILVSLIAAGGAWFYLKAAPVYQARAILMVQPGDPAQSAGGFEPGDLLELALSSQVLERTNRSAMEVNISPKFQAQVTAQKRLLLMSKAGNPPTAASALDRWIAELKKEYEITFHLNSIQQKKRQENVLTDLVKRYQDQETEYRQFLAREQPVALQESLKATIAEYSKLVGSQLSSERQLVANQAATAELRAMISTEARAGGEWKGLLNSKTPATQAAGEKNGTPVREIAAQLNELREKILNYKIEHKTGELEAFKSIQMNVLTDLEKHLATLNTRQNSLQSQIQSLEFALRNTPQFTEQKEKTPNFVYQLITADKIRAQADLASIAEQVGSCTRAIAELKKNLAVTIEQSVKTSSDLKKLETDQQSLAKIHDQLFENFIRVCRQYWKTASDDQVLQQVRRAEGATTETLRSRLQELTTRSLGVTGRDQRYQADLAETKKNINQASAKILQLNMLTDAVPDVIKTVLSPSEPVGPLYSPIKYTFIAGILAFGLLGIVTLLIGAGKNVR